LAHALTLPIDSSDSAATQLSSPLCLAATLPHSTESKDFEGWLSASTSKTCQCLK